MREAELYPLVRRRHEIYSTWWGGNMRSRTCFRPLRDCLAVIVVAFATLGLYKNLSWMLLVAAGYVAGTLFEYWAHCYVFHQLWKVRGFGEFEHIHMPHHFEKEDGISAGPLFYFPLMLVKFGLFYLVFGSVHAAASVLCGILIWFCAYEIFHDVQHFKASRPAGTKGVAARVPVIRFLFYESWFGRSVVAPYLDFMDRFHEVHHDENWKANFGISQPMWDRVFGTYVRPSSRSQIQ